MGNTIITIGREAGSGGRMIGRMVAEKLGFGFYDKELLERASKDSGLCQEIFENHDEKSNSSFLYSLVMDTYSLGYNSTLFHETPINQKVFLAQFETIKKIAEEESCVIVGRCADYALADNKGLLSVFIQAPRQVRRQHLMNSRGLDAKQAKEIVKKTDKQRSSYYNYYTSRTWGAANNYDLCLNSDMFGYEGCVDLICQALAAK